MRNFIKMMCSIAAVAILSCAPDAVHATPSACKAGTYGEASQNIVVLEEKAWIPSPELGYLLLDGRYGSTLDQASPIRCGDGYVFLETRGSELTRLEKRSFNRTSEKIRVPGAVLTGELLEPLGQQSAVQPLVVMVHGSETEPAINNNRAYLLAAQGIAVFTYDKRGTGQSTGIYTQNFELLADDAAAAMAHAKVMKRGHIGRSGYWGQSQGGWVAPLAASRSKADFVAVGFGLIAAPIEEDRDQMLLEAQRLGLRDDETKQIAKLSEATAAIVSSHFTSGFEKLNALRIEAGSERWVREIQGEYSGDMLRMSDSDLRRIGRAVFDNLEIIWDYDSKPVLQKLKIPLLWVIAEKDREAPIVETVASLRAFRKQGKPFDAYIFPHTDHGMYEFTEKADGNRTNTRVTEGYFKLVGDWIAGRKSGHYGRGRSLSSR